MQCFASAVDNTMKHKENSTFSSDQLAWHQLSFSVSHIWQPAVGMTVWFLRREEVLEQDCVRSVLSSINSKVMKVLHNLSPPLLTTYQIWIRTVRFLLICLIRCVDDGGDDLGAGPKKLWTFFHYFSTVPFSPPSQELFFSPQSSLVLISSWQLSLSFLVKWFPPPCTV